MTEIEAVVARLRTVDWLRLQLGVIAGFHALSAATLLTAPERQVVTAGTLPVLDLVPGVSIMTHRLVWAVVYAVVAGLLAATWLKPTIRRQWAGWLSAIPVGFIWAGAFGIAVIDGAGSALGLIIWITLISWWGTVAVATGVATDPAPHAR